MTNDSVRNRLRRWPILLLIIGALVSIFMGQHGTIPKADHDRPMRQRRHLLSLKAVASNLQPLPSLDAYNDPKTTTNVISDDSHRSVLGFRMAAPGDNPPTTTTTVDNAIPPPLEIENVGPAAPLEFEQSVLDFQMVSQREFQLALHELQHPRDCENARIFLKGGLLPAYRTNGLCVKLNDMGKSLEIAMATERTMVISNAWESFYEPDDCQSVTEKGSWQCLWDYPSSCTEGTIGSETENPSVPASPSLNAARGIFKESSKFHDTLYYGPQRIVNAPSWNLLRGAVNLHIDHVAHYERTHGKFWVRSQTAHFLWRPNRRLQNEINARMPSELTTTKEPYIAFHVRLTDNIQHYERDFGRRGADTKSLQVFMEHAMHLRNKHPGLRYIYLATDNDEVIAESKSDKWKAQGWIFVFQKNVVRSTGEIGYDWFRDGRSEAAAAVCTDLEMMRRADYLVGSFHSNVYRLGTQLNMAWNMDKYPLHLKRHIGVDVEFYEDP